MSEIWISQKHTIINGINTESKDGPFEVAIGRSDCRECKAVISTKGKEIVCKAIFDVSDSIVEALGNEVASTDMPAEFEAELTVIGRLLAEESRRVLRLLQQEIRAPKLLSTEELSSPPEDRHWSVDGKEWRLIKGQRLSGAGSVEVIGKLTEGWRARIQVLIDQDEKPLIAMQHWYEAARSDGRRFKWIEATIAAELAVKEILIRIEPKLEVILCELPSPPLDKLYGKILKSVAGAESPYKNKMHKGAVKRNKLIHRPEAIKLGHQEVFDYVRDVSEAITHLIELHRELRA